MNTTSKNCTSSSREDGRRNDSNREIYTIEFSAAQDLFPIFLSLLIIIINSFVLLLVYKRKALRTVTNFILCSLAVSDLFTGLFSLPNYIACNMTWNVKVCLMALPLLQITSVSTVLHLLMVTIDRYLAIIYSLRYHSLVTKRRATIFLAIIWTVSLFMGLIQLAWYITDDLNVYERPESIKDKEIPYDILSIIVFFGIPLIAMIVTYSFIFFEVLRQSRNIKKNSVPGCLENRHQTRHEWKAALMFAVMLTVFTVCWLPYFILRLQQDFGNNFIELSHVAEYILHMLRFLTSFINPCLYIFGKHDFRKALRKVFGWARRPSRPEMTRSSLLKTSEM